MVPYRKLPQRFLEEAFQLVDELGSDYVKVLFDISSRSTRGISCAGCCRNLSKIGHIHCAGSNGATN